MKVTWLGHSCFKIINDNGLTIITDPYNNYIGYNLPAQKADIVTVSHSHKDHSAIENVVNCIAAATISTMWPGMSAIVGLSPRIIQITTQMAAQRTKSSRNDQMNLVCTI